MAIFHCYVSSPEGIINEQGHSSWLTWHNPPGPRAVPLPPPLLSPAAGTVGHEACNFSTNMGKSVTYPAWFQMRLSEHCGKTMENTVPSTLSWFSSLTLTLPFFWWLYLIFRHTHVSSVTGLGWSLDGRRGIWGFIRYLTNILWMQKSCANCRWFIHVYPIYPGKYSHDLQCFIGLSNVFRWIMNIIRCIVFHWKIQCFRWFIPFIPIVTLW